MPSPFPGMDPFLERDEWGDVHFSLMIVLKWQLTSKIVPKYYAHSSRRIYQDEIEWPFPLTPKQIAKGISKTSLGECRETYVEVNSLKFDTPLTRIEMLSPFNKRAGFAGWHEYEKMRSEVLASGINLVEIDLRRGGDRPSAWKGLVAPDTDYCCVVNRPGFSSSPVVIEWQLPRTLPTIPVPLSDEDGDVALDLQQAFNTVYDDSRYEWHVNYERDLKLPVSEEQAEWLAGIVQSIPNRKLSN